jgi:hypothetical protein
MSKNQFVFYGWFSYIIYAFVCPALSLVGYVGYGLLFAQVVCAHAAGHIHNAFRYAPTRYCAIAFTHISACSPAGTRC